MDGSKPLLSAENLALVRGGRQLFDGVGLTLLPGQVLLLRGPNGSGKSSLLLTLAGLLRPERGSMAPEEPEPLHLLGHASGVKSRLTLTENLEFWRRVNGSAGIAPAMALERVGLGHLGAIEAGHLSAGQTRRLALARLLVSNRRIWLLDEPLAALDAEGADLVVALIAGQAAAGGGVIAATHDDIAGATDTLWLGATR